MQQFVQSGQRVCLCPSVYLIVISVSGRAGYRACIFLCPLLLESQDMCNVTVNVRQAGGGTVSGDRSPEAMLAGFVELNSMVNEIWSDTAPSHRPKIIGPDNDFDWSTFNIILNYNVHEILISPPLW
eukprot:SAG31_NODE_12472_length_939_cov_1.085714_1_plen_126_part_10